MKGKNEISELVNRASKGEKYSCRVLYDRYVKSMLINSKSIVGDLATAEDIVQESFVKAFQSLKTLKNPLTFGSWLRAIVYRKSIDVLNKSNRSLVFVDTFSEDILKEEDIEIYDLPIKEMRQAISSLPSGCQSVLKMHVYEGLTHQEIADFLGLSVSNSKSQYRYALKRLKDCLIEKVKHEA